MGEAPSIPKCVVIFAPHTSNWDFPLLVLVRMAAGKDVSYLGKHTLFKGPLGFLFRELGGIPVERDKRKKYVDQIIRLFNEREHFWLALSPEGTREKTDHWKTGFYRVALGAGVPVLLTYVDRTRKHCGIGPLLELSGDADQDLEQLRAFYSDKVGIHPELASEIRFRANEGN